MRLSFIVSIELLELDPCNVSDGKFYYLLAYSPEIFRISTRKKPYFSSLGEVFFYFYVSSEVLLKFEG